MIAAFAIKWQKGFEKEQNRLTFNLISKQELLCSWLSVNCITSGDVYLQTETFDAVSVRGSTYNSYLLETVKACLIIVHTMCPVTPHHDTLILCPIRPTTNTQRHTHSSTDTQSETGLFQQRGTVASVSDADSVEC